MFHRSARLIFCLLLPGLLNSCKERKQEVSEPNEPVSQKKENPEPQLSFENIRTPSEARQWLLELKGLNSEEAVAQIKPYLSSGKDLDLDQPFKLSADGTLASCPTLRTALLDLLLEIDHREAIVIGHEILETQTHPDEWAIALRNIAKHEEDLPFLKEKTLELINNPEWQEKPSTGYFESFDLLVHTEAIETTPLLSSFIQKKDRKDLRHAAFVTLDRLATQNTAEMISQLSEDATLEKAYPAMVAQQMARADLRVPEQSRNLKNWLKAPERSKEQLTAFLDSFPNANQMFSPRLITKQGDFKAPSPELAAAQRKVVQRWISERSSK